MDESSKLLNDIWVFSLKMNSWSNMNNHILNKATVPHLCYHRMVGVYPENVELFEHVNFFEDINWNKIFYGIYIFGG